MAYTNINNPSNYFSNKLYTGNGSTQSITGVGFQPDMVWIKDRSGVAVHVIQDAVRGATGTDSYLTIANDAASNINDAITSFDSDGFSLGADANNRSNTNGNNHVAFNWLAGNGTSSNTDGDITSTVSVNNTSGFSIVKYVGNGSMGATIGHGLSTAPKVIISKNLDNGTDGWQVLCTGFSGSACLNETIGFGGDWTNYWGATNPTSSVFTVGTNSHTNGSGQNIIAYCFAEKQGFSKFNTYVGTGSTSFVYTGFKPAWVMVKNTTASDSWVLANSASSPYNYVSEYTLPNLNNAESTVSDLRVFLSNGFYSPTASQNASGNTFFYMAFAEHPLVSSTGTPCTAR